MTRTIPLLALLTLTACTQFTVRDFSPDGSVLREVTEKGAPLISRKSTFTIKHQWLDENNVLHEETITRGVDENADAQSRFLNHLIDRLDRLQAAKALGQGASTQTHTLPYSFQFNNPAYTTDPWIPLPGEHFPMAGEPTPTHNLSIDPDGNIVLLIPGKDKPIITP